MVEDFFSFFFFFLLLLDLKPLRDWKKTVFMIFFLVFKRIVCGWRDWRDGFNLNRLKLTPQQREKKKILAKASPTHRPLQHEVQVSKNSEH